ncbi:MAG: phosphonate C-P lyase system protein PhnG [Rhodopseudomonas sp.]|nr:phosphonate C-P lyase system protein PhnG [Rhodopseudomonas sp.]
MSSPDPRPRGPDAAHDQRRAVMAVLARAQTADIARGLNAIGGDIDFTELRAPEVGLVMLRGRIGGDGAPFNAGEATVTRAAVQLASGEKGFGYALGRDRDKARLIALCDALWQREDKQPDLEALLLTPLRRRHDADRDKARAQTAATRVDFFTLVRGEDDR